LLDVIAGPDERDATTQVDADAAGNATGHPAESTRYADAADGDVGGLAIGVPEELITGVDDAVEATVDDALAELEAQGATLESVSLPSIEPSLAAYYVIAMAEASSNLARFDGVRYGLESEVEGNWNATFGDVRERGFGEEVKRRILLGTYALSAGYHGEYYREAQEARAWVRQDFDAAFDSVDVLASPTMPTLPFELGENLADPMTLYLMDANTVPVNLANLPAISVPAGASDGLPVGLQLIGPAFGEERILRAGSALA
jgi:aspartyl-tRNA(Asn)/glutamyl-tRNA(Gln) amidotransferase subunit A